MEVGTFLHLFLEELKENQELHGYYKLAVRDKRFYFRMAYLQQRLQYIADQLPEYPCHIWDAGCGYGTTSLFLALNGHTVLGTTLEFYFETIRKRLNYWKQYGDLTALEIRYEDIFEIALRDQLYDRIVVQDTLHHLEPVAQALEIFSRSLKPGGRLVAIEENGDSLYIRLKNIRTRGFKRITSYRDKKLNKTILMGNENARGLDKWTRLSGKAGFLFKQDTAQYIRLYPPRTFSENTYSEIIKKEQNIKNKFLKKYFYMGINFIFEKK